MVYIGLKKRTFIDTNFILNVFSYNLYKDPRWYNKTFVETNFIVNVLTDNFYTDWQNNNLTAYKLLLFLLNGLEKLPPNLFHKKTYS